MTYHYAGHRLLMGRVTGEQGKWCRDPRLQYRPPCVGAVYRFRIALSVNPPGDSCGEHAILTPYPFPEFFGQGIVMSFNTSTIPLLQASGHPQRSAAEEEAVLCIVQPQLPERVLILPLA